MSDIVLSEVAYWKEGDQHIFRSVEFDVFAAAPGRDEAVAKFVENAEDYAKYLAELGDEGSVDEHETATLILRRLADVYRAQLAAAQHEARRLIRLPRRHSAIHSPSGYWRSPHKKSSEPSPA